MTWPGWYISVPLYQALRERYSRSSYVKLRMSYKLHIVLCRPFIESLYIHLHSTYTSTRIQPEIQVIQLCLGTSTWFMFSKCNLWLDPTDTFPGQHTKTKPMANQITRLISGLWILNIYWSSRADSYVAIGSSEKENWIRMNSKQDGCTKNHVDNKTFSD